MDTTKKRWAEQTFDQDDRREALPSDSPQRSLKRARFQEQSSLPLSQPLSQEQEQPEEEEEDDDDEGDQVHVQHEIERIRQERMQADSRNSDAAQSGVIERVELKNFMCHSNFSIDLGPQLNFVVGHNGSGKSAILTAITIALGGKASATSRATSLKNFVKEGCNTATVTLTLQNMGIEAFKPDIYGDRIIIERRIAVEGTNMWKIKDENGKTVANTRSEIDALCDHANIQADNPMNILSQDAARQFLAASNPSEIYKFFLEGTQLSQLAREYDLVDENIAKMRAAILQKSSSIAHLERAAEEAKNRWDLVQKTRGYQAKIDTLNTEMIWAQVGEKEATLSEAITVTESLRDKLTAVKENYQGCISRLKIVDETILKLEQQGHGRSDQQAPLLQEREKVKRLLKEKTQALRDIESEERTLGEQYNRIRETIRAFQDQIDEETAKLADDGRSRRHELEQQREELIEKRDSYQDDLVEREEELKTLLQSKEEAETQHDEAGQHRRQLRDKAEEIESRISNLRESSSNRVTAFGGPRVPQLLKVIENDRAFKQKPVGPLGMYLKLKDMKWSRVLESVIGNTLNAFFVTNHQDRSRLQQHARRLGLSPLILTAKDEAFDYRGGEPDPSILTILRVLEFENDTVMRQLISSVRIESSALVDRRVDGDALMRRKPRNVQAAFSADLYSVRGGEKSSVSTALNEHRGPSRFSHNQTQELQRLQDAREELDPQLQRADARVEELRKKRISTEKQYNTIKATLPSLQREIRSIQAQIARVDEDLHEDQPGNIAAIESAKEEAESEAEKVREQFKEIQERKQKVEAEVGPLKEESERLKSQLETFEEARHEVRKQLEMETAKRIKHTTDRDHWRPRIEKLEEGIHRAEEEEKKVEDDLTDCTTKAQQYCERVETDRPVDVIEQELENLVQLKQRAVRESGVSLEQASEELQSRRKAMNEAREELDAMSEAQNRLKEALTIRFAKWHAFRRFIAIRAKSNFTHNLGVRGYSGELIFNHKSEKLSLTVQTEDVRSVGSRKKDAKSLSGGEKSFATVCMLLSLWQAMNSPIRCLDEFDVFMDQVNRKVALSMIMDETKASPQVQFILITPQDMPSGVGGNGVSIHKIRDPQRAQGLLSS